MTAEGFDRWSVKATEWAVRIRGTLGNIYTEYRQTEEAAEALRSKYDVVSIEKVTRTLDY